MAELIKVIMYFIFFVSMLCAISVSVKLYSRRNNYLIAVLAAEMALTELIVLFTAIWIDDYHSLPKAVCFAQGIAIQYSAYSQIITALCFSFHIYQLLVNRKQESNELLRKIYVGSIVIIPIIMTIIVAIVAVKTDAVKPFYLNCDIGDPFWVKLIGYPGFNFVLSFIGVYFSAFAAYKVFRHLDQFKTHISARWDGDQSLSVDLQQSNSTPNSSPTLQNQIKAYNMTRAAALRMVLFSLGFALLNVASVIQTILSFVKKEGSGNEDMGLRGNDLAGAFMGMIIFFVFGLPRKYDM